LVDEALIMINTSFSGSELQQQKSIRPRLCMGRRGLRSSGVLFFHCITLVVSGNSLDTCTGHWTDGCYPTLWFQLVMKLIRSLRDGKLSTFYLSRVLHVIGWHSS
jgi:hypothetical protein